MALIEARNLYKQLIAEIPVTLVNNVSLVIEQGTLTSIKGPSGSGKSSLLYLLGLLDKPDQGELIIDKTETTKLSENELANFRLNNLGFVFQFHFLLPEFTALENVMLPMQKLGKLSNDEMQKRAFELLLSLDLEKHIHKIPQKLSGGQSQRVAIARALANEPKLILADEPTGNLDSKSSANVREILKNLALKEKCTVIVVTHDPLFSELSDQEIQIVDGSRI
jgi:lipoprotein-releasing system ATP-binding protein